jgi:hypothetical protein
VPTQGRKRAFVAALEYRGSGLGHLGAKTTDRALEPAWRMTEAVVLRTASILQRLERRVSL